MVERSDGIVRPSSPGEARDYLSRIREMERKKEEESPEAARNELRGLRTMATETLDNPSHVLPELLQNADDVGGSCTKVTVEVTDEALVFWNHNEPMEFEDVEALGEFTKSTKRGNLELIGHFGIGFKTVFSLTDTPYIHSGYFSFRYSDENPTVPIPVEYDEQPATGGEYFDGTTIVLPFTDEAKQGRVEILREQVDELASMMPFLNNVTEIEVWGGGNQQVYCREHSADGSIKVIQRSGGEETVVKRIRLFSEAFSPDEALLNQLAERRHLDVVALQERDPEIEITIGIPVDGSGAPRPRSGKTSTPLFSTKRDGSTTKRRRTESHLFCHFPTEPDTRLPFDVQADFSLKPDRKSIAWPDEFNKQLLRRVPSVFEKAFVQFRDEQVDPSRVLELIPQTSGERPAYLDSMVERIVSFIKTEPCVPDQHGGLFRPVDGVFLGHPFRDLLTEDEVSRLLDRDIRYPSDDLSKRALSRLRSIVPENGVSVSELLSVVDASIFESKSETWLVRFMAGVKRHWNSKYDSGGLSGLVNEDREGRRALLNKVKSVPFLPLEGGGVTSYTAVDGEIYRLQKGYSEDYELFRGTDRLTLLSEEFLSAVDDPEEDLEQEAELAGELLFDRVALTIPTLESDDVVEEVINPAFESGSLDPERADQYVLFVSRRPKSLAEEATIKLRSRGSQEGMFAPETLYLGEEYIHAYDSETVFAPFSGVRPVSDHYTELDDRSREEWVESLAALGVNRRIEVTEQDPWESDRFTSQEAAREFLDQHGDRGQTEIHDERLLKGYNGQSSEWAWMKREQRRRMIKRYKYAFIDRYLPTETREVLEELAGAESNAFEFWKEFLKMIDAEWEEYYQDTMYRVYKYSEYGNKYRVKEGECLCPSSFGLFLRETVWCPGSDGQVHQPTALFIQNDRTKSKPVTFIEPKPTSLELIDFLGVQQYPGIQVTVTTIQEKVAEYRNELDSDEIDHREIQQSIRHELWGVSQELSGEGLSDTRDLEALNRLKEIPFLYVDKAEPAFRTPSEVTWEGPALGEYRVPISDDYADFKSLLVEKLGVSQEPTLEDCISFLGTTTVSTDSGDDAVSWTDIETAWRRVLQESVYLSKDSLGTEDDPLADTAALLRETGRVPTAGQTLRTWGDVQYHTTDEALLTNPPDEVRELTLTPIRDDRYKDEVYLERLEELTGTTPLEKGLNRTIRTEIGPENYSGSLRSVYPQILDTAYSYFVSIGAEEAVEDLQALAEIPTYEVDVISCRYTLDDLYDGVTDDVRCLIDSTAEKRIIIATEGRAEFALITFLVQEFQLNKTDHDELITLLKGALGKPDDLIRAYLEDDNYEYHHLPSTSLSARDDSDEEQPGTEEDRSKTSTTTATGETEDREDILEDRIGTPPSPSKTQNDIGESDFEKPDPGRSDAPERPTSNTKNEQESGDTQTREEFEDPLREDDPTPDQEPRGLDELTSTGGNSGGGGGGSQQPEIGARGEGFVFDTLRNAVESHFETFGRLESTEESAQRCVIHGEVAGSKHEVQIRDVSQYNRGYDILLSGIELATHSQGGLSIDGLSEGKQTFIEVKSTKKKTRKFGLSRNEYLIAIRNPSKYVVVRVFSVNSEPTIDRVFHDLPRLYEQIQGAAYYPNGLTIEYTSEGCVESPYSGRVGR